MLNRSAVIVRVKEPFAKWLNDADPREENPGISIENANQDCNVYLITEEDGENIEEWIALNHKSIFENELEGWYTDESLWPQKRDRKTFDQWISLTLHSVIYDTVGGPIVDDEL